MCNAFVIAIGFIEETYFQQEFYFKGRKDNAIRKTTGTVVLCTCNDDQYMCFPKIWHYNKITRKHQMWFHKPYLVLLTLYVKTLLRGKIQDPFTLH